MSIRSTYSINTFLMLALVALTIGCQKKEYALPTAKDALQNDVIKRSQGPNIAGQQIEFAYAMALPEARGKLTKATVEASIPGAAGTFLEHRSFYTNPVGGADVPVVVGDPSTTDHGVTTVNFTVDTFASTLRYYYVVPDEARGKQVTFKFTVTSSNGETAAFSMGPYSVAKMTMKRLIPVSDNNLMYISLADMTAYNATDAAANAGKIDLVYLYRTYATSQFNHALVSPAANAADYLPGVTLPAGVNRDNLIRKVFNLQDFNLAQSQFGIYIDDLDFEKLDLTNSPNYAINLKAEAGVWIETADKKYRGYIYFNSVNNGAKTAVISIKRYEL
jgi:hypothetical protein